MKITKKVCQGLELREKIRKNTSLDLFNYEVKIATKEIIEELKLKPGEFKCAVCKQVFGKLLSEEEAQEQLKREFPGHVSDDCGIVCHDCFEAMGF